MRNYETSPAWETSPAAAAAGLKLVQSSYLVRICSVVLQPLAGNCIFASNTSIGRCCGGNLLLFAAPRKEEKLFKKGNY